MFKGLELYENNTHYRWVKCYKEVFIPHKLFTILGWTIGFGRIEWKKCRPKVPKGYKIVKKSYSKSQNAAAIYDNPDYKGLEK